MDAPNPSANVTFANKTPLRIGAVGLKARDLSRLADSMKTPSGCRSSTATARPRASVPAASHFWNWRPRQRNARRPAHRRPLSYGVPAADARRPGTLACPCRQAPRAALRRSDHLVSEAIYLDDPEGNGIEVYRDRMPEEWRWNGDRIQMATDRLDLDNLAADAGNVAHTGAPDGLRIGTFTCASAILPPRKSSIAARSGLIRRQDAAAPCSCRPGAITTTSAATPGTRRAPGSGTTIVLDCRGLRSKPKARLFGMPSSHA